MKKNVKSRKALCILLTTLMVGGSIPGQIFLNMGVEKVYAEETVCIVGEDVYRYEVLGDGTIAIVGYIGHTAKLAIPSQLDGKKITKLAEDVFKSNDDLREVTIPEGVTDIGNSAFWDCKNLKEIRLPETLEVIDSYCFYGCESLDNINIPRNVNVIGLDAFYECNNLRNICVSEENKKYKSVEGVLYNKEGTYLLQYPSKKEGGEFVIPDKVDSIAGKAFYKCTELKCVSVSEGVKYIGDEAFYECSNLESINIPEGVTEIARRTFYKCCNLKEIVIPLSVTKIGHSAFYECSSLSSLQLGEGVKIVEEQAFMYCENLPSVNIPMGVVEIGRNAFASCKSLLNINVHEKNDVYKSIDGVLFNKKGDLLIRYPSGKKESEYIVPSEVTKIAEWAFEENSNLVKIDIPDTVISIGNTAFCDCRGLEEIKIPVGVTSIESSTFVGCKSLISIYIHEGVTNITTFAFSGCTSLENIDVSDKNMNYSSYEGVLLNKVGDTLVMYPAGKSNMYYAIPEKVVNLEYGAFFSCNNLTTLVFPKGMEGLNSLNICECKNLKEIIVSDGATKINFDAQADSDLFTSIKIPASVKEISDKTIGYYSYYDDNYDEHYEKIQEFTIYGYSGTEAEIYAKENGLDFVSLVSETDNKHNISVEYCVNDEKKVEGIQVNELVKGEETYDSLELEEKLVDDSLLTEEIMFKVYDINFVDESNKIVKTDVTSWIKIMLPDNFNCEESKIYFINENGIVSNTEAVYYGKYLMFKTNKYGTYVISEWELSTELSYINGDSNNDGMVDTQDAVLIKKYLAGYTDMDINEDACDVNNDGEISSADAVMVLKYLAGYEEIFVQ